MKPCRPRWIAGLFLPSMDPAMESLGTEAFFLEEDFLAETGAYTLNGDRIAIYIAFCLHGTQGSPDLRRLPAQRILPDKPYGYL